MDSAVAELKKLLLIIRRKKYFRDYLLLLKTPKELTLTRLLKRSERFPIEFPISSVKTENILKLYLQKGVDQDVIEEKLLDNARESYPVVHESFFEIALDFLEHKRKFGSSIEKEFYEEMNLLTFISRLIRKRAVYFFGGGNHYMLVHGPKEGSNWKEVGTKNEHEPLVLEKCLSYDEMKLSALITISSPSYFLNQGSRTNGGILSDKNDYEEEGIVIGVVGCRFPECGVMDYQDMIIDPEQNVKKYGYGMKLEGEQTQESDFLNIFAKHYLKNYYPLWDEVDDIMRRIPVDDNGNMLGEHETYSRLHDQDDCYFDKDIFKVRSRVTAEVILLEANERGFKQNKKVFLHIGGIGELQFCTGLETIFLEGFSQAIDNLDLPNISDIFFSLFQEGSTCGGVKNKERIGKNNILIHFGMRYPHDKIHEETDDDIKNRENKLSVVTYACNENSIAGNEFWIGLCAASGDSSQASSSQIAELHNPHINPRICGSNLRVASPSIGSILTISEYLRAQLTEMVLVKRRMHTWFGEVTEEMEYPTIENDNEYNYYPYQRFYKQ